MRYKDKQIDIMHEVVVPVSNKQDTEKTVKELSYFDPDHITIVHLVENNEQTPKDVHEDVADELHSIVLEEFEDAEFELVQSDDIVKSISETAMEKEATSIVFRPAETTRIANVFSQSNNLRMITNFSIPVIALPDPEDME